MRYELSFGEVNITIFTFSCLIKVDRGMLCDILVPCPVWSAWPSAMLLLPFVCLIFASA